MHGICFHTCYRRRSSREQSPHVLVPKNTCKGIIDNTCDIGDFRAHIFCPQTTQELYLRSTMEQDRLNNCLLMHCHKSITDTLANMKTAKRFLVPTSNAKVIKKKIWVGVWVLLSERWVPSPLPPPPPRFKTLSRLCLLCYWGSSSAVLSSRKVENVPVHFLQLYPGKPLNHRGPTQSVCVTDINVLDLQFPSFVAMYR